MHTKNVEILDAKELGQLIKRSPQTILGDLCRNPERIPTCFKLPGSKKPLWLKSDVDEFLREQAARHGAAKSEQRTTVAKLGKKSLA